VETTQSSEVRALSAERERELLFQRYAEVAQRQAREAAQQKEEREREPERDRSRQRDDDRER
jgi:hypothetical protein